MKSYAGAHLEGVGGGYIPCPRKEKCIWTRPFAPKMPHKGLKWPKMPWLKINIPCPALILDAPLLPLFIKPLQLEREKQRKKTLQSLSFWYFILKIWERKLVFFHMIHKSYTVGLCTTYVKIATVKFQVWNFALVNSVLLEKYCKI